jgi:hypothetical protein
MAAALFSRLEMTAAISYRPPLATEEPMPLLALDDAALQEIMNAAATVPPAERSLFLERVAAELGALPVVGPGNAHAVAFRVARDFGTEVLAAHHWTRMPSKSKLINGK